MDMLSPYLLFPYLLFVPHGATTTVPPPPSFGEAEPSTLALVGGVIPPPQHVFSESTVATSTMFDCAFAVVPNTSIANSEIARIRTQKSPSIRLRSRV